MSATIRRAVGWMRRRAENVVAGMLGIMFVCFIVQIVFRYFFNFPIGWTSELSVVMWLYMALVGSAFWLKESEEIRFDLISGALPPIGRRVVGLVVAVATVVLFGMALPATIKYVTFMKVESSSYLKIRLDILYSIYIVFAVAVIVRYAWSIVSLLRGEAPEEVDNHRNGYSKKTVVGEEGAMEIEVPRDRSGSFDPLLIAKGQKRFEGFDEKIIAMYARGMTVREIQGFLLDHYRVEVSADFISTVTDSVLEAVVEWQNRPLERSYPVVYFDALRVKIRDEGSVRNKAVYLALGIAAEGTKDVLGIWIEQNEGAKFWLKVMNELRNRGGRRTS